MSYRIKLNRPLIDNIRRIADEQLDSAISTIDDPELKMAIKVHQVRKHCKKMRGLIRLVRPALGKTYNKENASYRDSAKILTGLRDARAMIGTCDGVIEYFDRQINRSAFESIRQRLDGLRKQQMSENTDSEDALVQVRKRLKLGRSRIDDWSLQEKGFDAIEGGILTTCQRSCLGLHNSRKAAFQETDGEAFHEWRKHVKYHWYHCRLLQAIWPVVMRARREETHRLCDLLGDTHDLVVLHQRIAQKPDEFGSDRDVKVFLSLTDQRRRQMESDSLELGNKLFAEEPEAIVSRFRSWWSGH